MKTMILGVALLGAATLPAFAQSTPGANPPAVERRDTTSGANTTTPPAVTTDEGTRRASTATPGANSFTEGQARSRMEAAGFSDVTGLQKDDQGIWRGQAMRNGSRAPVALDFQGNVSSPAN